MSSSELQPGAEVTRRTLLGGAACLSGGLAAGCATSAERVAAAPSQQPYFKCTEFVRRGPGLTPQGFLDHWQRRRAPLLRQLPGLRGLTFNLVDHARTPNLPYHGVIEFWFDSPTAYAAAVNQANPDLIEALMVDRKAFMQEDFMGLFSREVVVRPARSRSPRPRAKRIGLVGRRPGMDRQTFFHDWVHEHAPAADRQPGLERYVLNLREQDRLLDSPWDGYAELWWTDWQAFEEASRAIKDSVGARLGFFYSHLLLYLDEYEEIPLRRWGENAA